MRHKKFYSKVWSLEKIYERLQEEAESDPTILNLKQDTVYYIRKITGCCSTKSFILLKELETEYDFHTWGKNEEREYTKKLLDSIGLKYRKGSWRDNRMYYSAVQYIFQCKNHQKEPDLIAWKEKYKTRRRRISEVQ